MEFGEMQSYKQNPFPKAHIMEMAVIKKSVQATCVYHQCSYGYYIHFVEVISTDMLTPVYRTR